jgi:hypothetical protein
MAANALVDPIRRPLSSMTAATVSRCATPAKLLHDKRGILNISRSLSAMKRLQEVQTCALSL